MEASGSNPGQPFIYAVSEQQFKFISSELGPPEQVSNVAYNDNDDPVVSFAHGNSAFGPRIWIGSPNPDSTNYGCSNDIFAYLDYEAATYNNGLPQTVTGINNQFVFGGGHDVGGGDFPYVYITKDSDWDVLSGSRTVDGIDGLRLRGFHEQPCRCGWEIREHYPRAGCWEQPTDRDSSGPKPRFRALKRVVLPGHGEIPSQRGI